MPNWRDELIEAAKTKAERDAEEIARQKKRVQEALAGAEAALRAGQSALSFASDQLRAKLGEVELRSEDDRHELALTRPGDTEGEGDAVTTFRLVLELSRETAVLKVSFGDGKPREFDFTKDRHISSADVEEYVGRRAVELVRAAQKSAPW